MALKLFKGLKSVSKFNINFARAISSTSVVKSSNNLVLIDVNDKTGYATVSLNKPPVNSMDAEFFQACTDAMRQLEKNRTRGVILTSTSPKIFCAGLDINQLVDPDTKTLRDLWSSVQDAWLSLFGSSFPAAAALNGHTIAAGSVLALSCEYRVMVPKYKFGLNEIQLAIEVSPLISDSMGLMISRRELELAILTGKLYTTEEAHKVGLIDELADDKEDALKKCEAFLDRFKNIPYEARSATKKRLRQREIDYINQNREQDIEMFVKTVQNETTQKVLKMYLNSLKNKK